LANKADHAAEAVALSAADAENALGLYLRAVEWFYYEADFGPRATPTRRKWSPLRWLCLITLNITVVAASLLVLFLWHSPATSTGPAVPPPVPLPAWANDLPASPVLALLAQGHPAFPPEKLLRPRFSLDLFSRSKGEGTFHLLSDGAALASHDDRYLFIVRPETEGFLYVFQIDTQGTVTWFWPENATWKLSVGHNPVTAGKGLQIPPAERHTALYLDANLGVEHLIAVFSAVRWPELETALEQAARATPAKGMVPDHLLITRGVEEETRGVGGEESIEVDGNRYQLHLSPKDQAAVGSFMVVTRWFHHVAPGQP
jgi:hypothetical protein